jgi:hypothetical protein
MTPRQAIGGDVATSRGRMAPMRRPRLQFRLSTLLWITLAVACWFGGLRYERWRWRVEREDLDFALFGGRGYPVFGPLPPLPPQQLPSRSDR